MSELMGAITGSIDGCSTRHQREVLVALALYRTLHDAPGKLRADLAKRGFTLQSI
jgi:hypothetical protein